jgi:hypothetical protein
MKLETMLGQNNGPLQPYLLGLQYHLVYYRLWDSSMEPQLEWGNGHVENLLKAMMGFVSTWFNLKIATHLNVYVLETNLIKNPRLEGNARSFQSQYQMKATWKTCYVYWYLVVVKFELISFKCKNIPNSIQWKFN